MATKYVGERDGLASVATDAGPERADPAPAMEFPGCDPVPMTWDEVWAYDGRIEYWDAASSTAQVLRDAGPVHEGPPNVLSEILTRISQERGSRIRFYGAVYLMERDAAGRPRRVMVADQTIYLRPGRWKPSDPAIIRDADPLPDVILEVDHTTDVRRNKLGLYESWGFPEVWVETPDIPSPNRPQRLRPGLTIYRLDEGRFRVSAESRAFPGWPAARIHAALNETQMSPPNPGRPDPRGPQTGPAGGHDPGRRPADRQPPPAGPWNRAAGRARRGGRRTTAAPGPAGVTQVRRADRGAIGRGPGRRRRSRTPRRDRRPDHRLRRRRRAAGRCAQAPDAGGAVEAGQADYRWPQRSAVGYRSRRAGSHRRGRRRSPLRSARFLIGMLLAGHQRAGDRVDRRRLRSVPGIRRRHPLRLA